MTRFLLLALALDRRPVDLQLDRITSTMAAVYTPMKRNPLNGATELDVSKIPAYAKLLKARNVTNVMPAGTNGESLSMTVPERKALAEAWAAAAPQHGLKVYMHIGSESVAEAADLAAHAQATEGISGIVCMTPLYFKPSLESLVAFLKEVAAAAPQLPFWYYHFPDDTGVLPGQANKVLELMAKEIPNTMGVKFTDYNMMDWQLCKQVGGGKYNMLFGRDEMAVNALQLGADAAVSSTVNYSPTLRDTIQLYERGEVAKALEAQARNAKLCSYFGAFAPGAKNVQKNLLKLAGLDVGPSRLPLVDLEPDELAALKAEIGEFLDEPLPDIMQV